MTNENRSNRLQELSGSNFEIADGEQNIRNWDVKDASEKKLGEVDELIFDEESQKVRYIVLDLDGNELNLEERRVLIPIGMAELHEKDDDVILRGVTTQQLMSLPEYNENNLGMDVETQVRSVFAGGGLVAEGKDFYDSEDFNDRNLYRNRMEKQKEREGATIPVMKESLEVGKREIETGGIRIRSRMQEKPVTENIRLREEHVNVDRKNVDRPAKESDFANAREGEIEIRERAEVPVINKDGRVVEEIKVSKDVTERDETIQGTVRNTEVDVDDSTKPRNA